MKSNTPETDSAAFEISGATPLPDVVVYASFAKGLEKERNEARDLLRKIQNKTSEPWDVGDTVTQMCNEYFSKDGGQNNP